MRTAAAMVAVHASEHAAGAVSARCRDGVGWVSEPGCVVSDQPGVRARSRIFVSSHAGSPGAMRSARSSPHPLGRRPGAAHPVEPRLERMPLGVVADPLDPKAGGRQVAAPLGLAVGAHMGGVAQPFGLLDPLVGVEGVLDHDQAAG